MPRLTKGQHPPNRPPGKGPANGAGKGPGVWGPAKGYVHNPNVSALELTRIRLSQTDTQRLAKREAREERKERARLHLLKTMQCGDPHRELNAAITLLRIDEGTRVDVTGKLTVKAMTSEQRRRRIAELTAQLGTPPIESDAPVIEGQTDEPKDD